MFHVITSRALLGLAMLFATACLMLNGCGCSGPDLPSYSAIKQDLDVLPAKNKSPILGTLSDKYLLEISKAVIEEKKESKDKTVTTYKWWNAVKLDGNAVAPEHRGKVGHLVLTNTTVHGKDAMEDYQFSYEIPKN